MKKKSFVLILLIIISVLSFCQFHPKIKWNQIENKRLRVIFPENFYIQAVNVFEIANRQLNSLEKYWGSMVARKIRIVLNPFTDSANGFATFFPFNLIEIALYPPRPEQAIAGSKDWIQYVLSHELTHMINMNFTSELLNFLRSIFGSNPLFYPFVTCGTWIIEGAAVMAESSMNPNGGRIDTPDYNLYLRMMKKKGEIPGLKKIYGDYFNWPFGKSPYVFGSGFFKFLKKQYGQKKIAQFLRFYSRHIMALFKKDTILDVFDGEFTMWEVAFNKTLFDLWDEFILSIRTKNNLQKKSVLKRVTYSSGEKKYPFLRNDQDLVYVNENYEEHNSIIKLNLESTKKQKLLKFSNVNSLSYTKNIDRLYYSANQVFQGYFYYSDIYYYDFKQKQKKRLSRGKRLMYPQYFNSDIIYCVRRMAGKAFIVQFFPESKKIKTVSKPFLSIADISISPDKKKIAAAVKRAGQKWQIAIFNISGKLDKILTNGDNKAFNPRWKDNNNIFFIQERELEYCLRRINLESLNQYIYSNAELPSIRYFNFSSTNPDKIIVSFFNSKGFDIGMANLSKISSSQIDSIKNKNTPETTGQQIDLKISKKKYSPLKDLSPKYFSPNFRTGGDEQQPGIYLNNQDSLRNINYFAGFYYGLGTRSKNLELGLNFKFLYPDISIRYHNLTDKYNAQNIGSYLQKRKIFKLFSSLPIYKNQRSSTVLITGLHLEKRNYLNNSFLNTDKLEYYGLDIGFYFNSVKRFFKSISNSDGMFLSLAFSSDLTIMGSSYNTNSFLGEFKKYISIGRPNTFAIRASYARSWGEGKRMFLLGGNESQSLFNMADNNVFNLNRGFPAGFSMGTEGYNLNFEYRISLFKIQQKWFLIQSFERVYLSLFTDFGQVWQKFDKISPMTSLGFELNLISYVFGEKMNFASGLAVGNNPYHKPMFFVRIGTSF